MLHHTAALPLLLAATAASADVPRSGHVPAGAIKLHYEVHGVGGTPLVLLHGGIDPNTVAVPLARLSEDRQVVAFHLQGHGHTPNLDRPMSYEAMADDVAAAMERLGLGEADLMGYSMGGGVALQVAIRHPERVSRLVAVSFPFASEGYHPEVTEAFRQMPANAEVIAGQVAGSPDGEAWPEIDQTAWATLFRKVGEMNAAGWDWSEDVARIEAPTLLVFADADIMGPAHAAAFYALLGGGLRDAGQDGSLRPPHQLAILPRTTHYDLPASPLLTAAVTSFLD